MPLSGLMRVDVQRRRLQEGKQQDHVQHDGNQGFHKHLHASVSLGRLSSKGDFTYTLGSNFENLTLNRLVY